MPQYQVRPTEDFSDLFKAMRSKVATGEGEDAPRATKPMLDSIDDFEAVTRHVIADILVEQNVTPETAQRVRRNGHQVVATLWDPHAAGYIGKVTDGSWYAMAKNAILTKLHQATHRMSGKWVLLYADWDTVIRHYVEKRGTFVGVKAEQQEQTISRNERHFFLPMVFGEVTGASVLQYAEKDGEVISGDPRSSMDASLVRAMQDIVDGQRQPEQAVSYKAENTELKERLARLEAIVVTLGTPAEEAAPQEVPAEPSARIVGQTPDRRNRDRPDTPEVDPVGDLDREMQAQMSQQVGPVADTPSAPSMAPASTKQPARPRTRRAPAKRKATTKRKTPAKPKEK